MNREETLKEQKNQEQALNLFFKNLIGNSVKVYHEFDTVVYTVDAIDNEFLYLNKFGHKCKIDLKSKDFFEYSRGIADYKKIGYIKKVTEGGKEIL